VLRIESKACRDCGEVKGASDFHRCASRKDGLMPFCKGCQRERSAATYSADREGKKAASRERGAADRERLRDQTFAAYGGECACCGEHEHAFLVIDHIDGGGSEERRRLNRRGWRFYAYLRDQGFPVGYRVLCHNCNAARGSFGTCPHEHEHATKEAI
jgi:hypothetical protein